MSKSINLKKLLSMNVREIEELFGKERLSEILDLLRSHEKIKEKDEVERELRKNNEKRNILILDLEKRNAELEDIEIAY